MTTKKKLDKDFIVFILMLCVQVASSFSPFVNVHRRDLVLETFTAPQANNYKSLSLHGDILYVGGKGSLFRQDARNISKPRYPPTNWTALQSDINRCKKLPQGSDANCYNYIRIHQPYNSSHMLLCGSNALQAQNAFLDVKSGTVHKAESLSTPFCNYNPADRGISIVGEASSSAATIAAVSRHQPPEQSNLVKNLPNSNFLFTTRGFGKMVESNAQFVSSFHHQDTDFGHSMNKLYFVFGETVNEPDYNREFGSRIAQVCADDLGGMSTDRGNWWTTFLKAPLLCQTNEVNPFVFNKVTHSAFSEDGFLYATFTTQSVSYRHSAVCAFNITEIQMNFHSKKFWGISESGRYQTKSSQFNNPAPGDCAHSGMNGVVNATTKDFSIDFLSFVENYPLVASPVFPANPLKPKIGRSGPIFVLAKENFSQIAVQRVKDVNGRNHTVIFVSSNSGKILKFLSILKNGISENRQLALYDIGSEEITGLLLSHSLNTLYVEAKSKVVQLSTGNCNVYSKPCDFCDPCRTCVLARDPMCAWSTTRKKCVDIRVSHEDIILRQDVTNGDVNICEEQLTPTKDFRDMSIHDPIGKYEILGEPVPSSSPISVLWFNVTESAGRQELPADPVSERYRISSDQLLEIKNFSRYDVATYIAEYRIEEALVAIKSTSYIKDKLPVVVPTVSTSTKLDTRSPAPKPPSHTINSPAVTDTVKTSTTQTNATVHIQEPWTGSSVTLIVLICLFSFLLIFMLIGVVFYRLKKNRSHNLKGHTSTEKNFSYDTVDYAKGKDVGADTVRIRNESNNSSKGLRVDDENDAISDDSKALLSPTPKQVAEVMPFVKNPDYCDVDVKQRKPKVHQRPKRAKSFQSTTIRVNVGDEDFRCHSIKRDRKSGMWLMAVSLPQDYTFDDRDSESGEEEQPSKFDTPPNPPAREPVSKKPKFLVPSTSSQSGVASTNPIHPVSFPVKIQDHPESDVSPKTAAGTSAFLYEGDTDSDSTIKAPQSSTASTPRSEVPKDAKKSDIFSQLTRNPEPGRFAGLNLDSIPHMDSIIDQELLPPPKRRKSSEKSPSSTESTLSSYTTPPTSPVEKSIEPRAGPVKKN